MNHLIHVDLETFASELSEQGRTTVLGQFRGTKRVNANFECQELVMLDFDNTDTTNIYSLEDLEEDLFIQSNACFVYQTFSDANSKVDKFRVVFCFDKPVFLVNDVVKIYQYLFMKYPMSDITVGQPNRLFFGSNSGFEEIDFDNRLLVDEIIDPHTKSLEIATNSVSSSLENYKLLKVEAYDLIKEKFGNRFSQKFTDEYEALAYFKKLNMKELLELPETKVFLDILHDETNPSASVFFNKGNNIYLYKCHSESAEFTGDIYHLLKRYLGKNQWEINKILIDITSSEVTNLSTIGQTKNNADRFIRNLYSNDRHYPHLESYAKRYFIEMACVLELMLNYIERDINNDLVHMNYFSIPRITSLISKKLGKKISIDKMKVVLNIMTATEIIRKLPKNEIPEILLNTIINQQEQDHTKLRTSNVYQITDLTTDKIERLEVISKELKDNKITVRSIGYEVIYRLFGEDKAIQDFNQSFKPLVKKGLKMSSKDSNLTKSSVSLELSAIKIIEKSIKEKGYIYEQDLIKILAKNRNQKQAIARQNYQKIRADLLTKYALEHSRLSNELYKQFNIKGKYQPKVIIYR